MWAALHVVLRQITVSVNPSHLLSEGLWSDSLSFLSALVKLLVIMWLLMLPCCVVRMEGSGCCWAVWTRGFLFVLIGFICLYQEMQEICLGGLTTAPWEVKFSLFSHVSSKPLLKTDDCSFRARWISINILDCSNWLCAIVMMEKSIKQGGIFTQQGRCQLCFSSGLDHREGFRYQPSSGQLQRSHKKI